MRYQIVFRPVGTNGVAADRVVDADGNVFTTEVLGNCPAKPSGNILTLLQNVGDQEVAPSNAQLTGFTQYLYAVAAESDTTSVEAAIALL